MSVPNADTGMWIWDWVGMVGGALRGSMFRATRRVGMAVEGSVVPLLLSKNSKRGWPFSKKSESFFDIYNKSV
jgi:hypothetical protein